MALGKGLGTFLGIAEEVTYGTGVSPTEYVKLQSESVQHAIETTFEESLDTKTIEYYTDGRKQVGGSLEMLLGYQGYEKFFKHALGSASSGAANGDGQVTHTITLADSLPTGLTLHIPKAASIFTTAFQYAGCLINKLSLSNEVGGNAKLALDIVGASHTRETVATPTYPTFKGVKWNHASTFTMNAVARKAQNVTVEIANKLEPQFVLGTSQTPIEYVSTGREVTGSVQALVDATTLYDLFNDRTEFACVFTWTGALIAGSSYYSLSVSMPKCVATGEAPKVGGKGVLPITIPFRAIKSSAVNDEIAITIKNLKTSV